MGDARSTSLDFILAQYLGDEVSEAIVEGREFTITMESGLFLLLLQLSWEAAMEFWHPTDVENNVDLEN